MHPLQYDSRAAHLGFVGRACGTVLLDVFHGEMLWLYRPDLPMIRPDARDLTARQRQTLQLLLAGNGEKQIATQLGIRPNTVHHCVKALYRHYGVSSRSELLARWVRKQAGPSGRGFAFPPAARDIPRPWETVRSRNGIWSTRRAGRGCARWRRCSPASASPPSAAPRRTSR